MNPYRSAAIAIAVALAAGLVTKLFHPSGRDVIQVAEAGGRNLVVTGLHAMAILAQPLLVCGMIALTAMLGFRQPIPVAALVFFCFNSMAVVIEAVASGFLAPLAVRGIAEADEVRRAMMLADLRYTGVINQGFASIQVILASVAILLWSWSAWRGRTISRAVWIVGALAGIGILAARLGSLLPLHVHGYLLVVVSQGVWFGTVAVALWRQGGIDARPGKH
jgi:hypothetical protein